MGNYLDFSKIIVLQNIFIVINLTSGPKVARMHLRCSDACSGQNFTKLNAQTQLKFYL